MINFTSPLSKWTLFTITLSILFISSCSTNTVEIRKDLSNNEFLKSDEATVPESKQIQEKVEEDEIVISVHASYQHVPPNERMNTATHVVQGIVREISETKYNSDDGKSWNHKDNELILSLHTITIDIENSLKGSKAGGDQIDITVLGLSPLDKYADESGHYHLKIGQDIIVYVNDTELIWKNNEKRPKYMFISSPDSSFMIKQSDGLYHNVHSDEKPKSLDELIDEASAK